jgi:hypothetical protein
MYDVIIVGTRVAGAAMCSPRRTLLDRVLVDAARSASAASPSS